MEWLNFQCKIKEMFFFVYGTGMYIVALNLATVRKLFKYYFKLKLLKV